MLGLFYICALILVIFIINKVNEIMNKTIKIILIIIGVGSLLYGIYTLITPEASLSIGDLDIVEVQDNTNAYVAIGIGIVVLLVSFIADKKL